MASVEILIVVVGFFFVFATIVYVSFVSTTDKENVSTSHLTVVRTPNNFAVRDQFSGVFGTGVTFEAALIDFVRAVEESIAVYEIIENLSYRQQLYHFYLKEHYEIKKA